MLVSHRSLAETVPVEVRENPRMDRLCFTGVAIFHVLVVAWLIADQRMVDGHDTFQLFSMQHYFLSNRVAAGEIPQWMPYMSHGTVSNWWYGLQATPLQNTLLLTGWFEGANFLPLFYLGMLVDELLFLLGMWLLARRYAVSWEARLLALLAASAVCLWPSQAYFNFRCYYLLPLALYFGHRCLETKRIGYLFLTAQITLIQSIGNIPYWLPVAALTIFVYLVTFTLSKWQDHSGVFQSLRTSSWSLAAATAFLLLLASCEFAAMKFGTDNIVMYNPGRNQDGTSSLQDFLHYGGHQQLSLWLELEFGVSADLDAAIYFGIAAEAMVFFGLLCFRRTLAPTVTAIVLILLSAGTIVAVVLYYVWPLMSYFRHLGLILPSIRIFLILIAVQGLERIIRGSVHPLFLALAGAGFASMAAHLLQLASKVNTTSFIVNTATTYQALPILYQFSAEALLDTQIIISALIATLCGLSMLAMACFRPRMRLLLAWCLLAVQAADIIRYRVFHLYYQTFHLNGSAYDTLQLGRLRFATHRWQFQGEFNSEFFGKQRQELLQELERLPRFATVRNWDNSYGMQYWSLHSYLNFDEAGSSYRIDHWLRPLDNFLRIYNRQVPGNLDRVNGHIDFTGQMFPNWHPAIGKIIGADSGKIQFFSEALLLSNGELARALVDEEYLGDILLLSSPQHQRPRACYHLNATEELLKANRRLPLEWRVLHFSANHLELEVNNTSGTRAWLLYSDVWDTKWTATVNELDQPIYGANLAYKAVELESGRNVVRFSFFSPLLSFCFTVLSLNSLALLIVGARLFIRCVRLGG